ncbi:MAG: methyltransferase domain-containing protein [Candidatus Methylacidiphilales bacterium]
MDTREHDVRQDWEARYQSGDTPWDKGQASPPLLQFLSHHRVAGEVIVPGCGLGHEVRALAEQGARVTGLDIAPSAIAQARQFHTVREEVYVCGDWLELPKELERRFDWVVEHTCFCALDPARRIDYVRACQNALRPGGALLAVFYMNPEVQGEEPPFGTTEQELDALFLKAFHLERDEVPMVAFPGREGRERLRLYRRT